MKKRTKLAASAGAALAVVGASGAVAADRLTPKEESKASSRTRPSSSASTPRS